jgi:OOP family OmpA-OmpF porin
MQVEKQMHTRKPQSRHNAPFIPAALSVLALSLLSSTATLAADNGWYVGGSYGETRADTINAQIVNALIGNGYTAQSMNDDENDRGYKFFGGYQFNDSFALEGGYFELGKFRYQAEMDRLAVVRGDSLTKGANFDLVGIKPLTENLSVFARVGAVYAESRSRRWDTGAFINQYDHSEEDDLSYKFGVGAQYDFSDALGIRLEAERYRIDDLGGSKSSIDMISLGLVYHFGMKTAVAAVPVSTPPVAAAAPRPTPPAPVVAPTPAPTPAPVRVTFSADSLFTFDSAVVQAAGMAELNTLAAELRGVDFDTILVTGHTDRFGSPAYNLRLSNSRATAVKDYLVNTAGIPAAKVTTRGVNGAEPVTTLSQCGPQLTRAQLIACLAPDRRVEVEVTGTRPR